MILVTGGTGLVGTHLLFDLCKSGKKVRVLTRKGSKVSNINKVFSYYSKETEKLLENIEWAEADLSDVYSLIDAMLGVKQVYHCAAMVSFEPKDEAEMIKTNIEGTANMVNAALEAGINKFCHVSSISSLGRNKYNELITEETNWKASPDNSNYSISKYGSEREVWRAAEEGLNMVIVNPSLIIGGGNWQQSSSNMFTKAHSGIKFYTGGGTGFVDVRDVSALMIKLMESKTINQRFILNSENLGYKRIFEIIHQEFGKPIPDIEAKKIMSAFAWRTEQLRHLLTGSKALITKETARSAHSTKSFSNQKILNLFPDYNFISIEQSLKDTCKLFLKDLEKVNV